MSGLVLVALVAGGLELDSDALAVEPNARLATATGHVRARTATLDLTCETAVARFGEPAPDGRREVVKLELSGAVHAVRKADGLVLDAGAAEWSRDTDRLHLSGDPVVRRGADVLRGERMSIAADGQDLEVREPRVVLARKSKDAARVSAERLVVADRGGRARFESRVVLRHGDAEATADRLEAWLDDGEPRRTVNQLRLEGAVAVTRASTRAFARRLDYDADTGDLVLEGQPRLERDGDRLEGERIVYAAADGRARVEKAVARVRTRPPR